MTMFYSYMMGTERRYFIETAAGRPVARFDELDTAGQDFVEMVLTHENARLSAEIKEVSTTENT